MKKNILTSELKKFLKARPNESLMNRMKRLKLVKDMLRARFDNSLKHFKDGHKLTSNGTSGMDITDDPSSKVEIDSVAPVTLDGTPTNDAKDIGDAL